MFLFTGLLTVSLGFVFLWIVPDNQLNCRWLTKEGQILSIERIRVNGHGVATSTSSGTSSKKHCSIP